jgi:phosphoglycerate dehydrogenase-like enzyme
MKVNVHYLQPPSEPDIDYLGSLLAPNVRLSLGNDDTPVPQDTMILIAGRPKRAHITSSPDLKSVVIPWTGIPPETVQLLAEFPRISVHNLHHNSDAVAELALALVLAAAKKILPMDRSLRANDWSPRYNWVPSLLLKGKVALILGYGAIGKQVAKFCHALGMTVLAVRRNPKVSSDEYVAEIHSSEALSELLPKSQVILLCLPLTNETEGIIGESEFNLLQPDSLIVNIGRGPLVDQAALFQALANGRLAGAGIDVWYNYPRDKSSRTNTPPADFPFHKLENVVMSPHRAGTTGDSKQIIMEHLADILNTAAKGETMFNQVDLDRGY